jgi:hypothetical protein
VAGDPGTGGAGAFGVILAAAGYAILPELRSGVRDLLAEAPIEVVQAAELIVTELATNAVAHGEVPGEARAYRTRGGRLRIEVDDASSATPIPCPAGGRGLAVVDYFAESWGVTAHRLGKTVWAELRHTSGGDGRRPGQ